MIVFLFDLFSLFLNRIKDILNFKKNKNSDLEYLRSLNNKDDCNLEDFNNEILLVEMNNFHFECLDSIIYYFNTLGYGVDVIVRKESTYNNAHKFTLAQILSFLNSSQTCRYEFVFFNTMILFLKTQHHILDLVNIKSKYGILGIYHSISDIKRFRDFENYNNHRYFALRDFNNWGGVALKGLSCSKEVDIRSQNNKTAVFISIGFLIYHRNFRFKLYHSISMLLNENITNFKFILIGRGDFKELKFKEYISFYKNPTNAELENILDVNNPNFTLGIFDNFAHKHYLNICTSGLRSFALTHNLPFVINKRFGEAFGFDNSNAIFYKNDIFESLKYAISIVNTQKYDDLRNNLHNFNQKLNQDSILLLKERILEIKGEKI